MPRWYYLPCICTTRARRRGPPSYPLSRTRGQRNRPSLSCSTSCPQRTATEATQNNVIETQHCAYYRIHPPWTHARTFLVAISFGMHPFSTKRGFRNSAHVGARHSTSEPWNRALARHSPSASFFYLRAAWLCRPCDRAWLLRPQFPSPLFCFCQWRSRAAWALVSSFLSAAVFTGFVVGPSRIFTREALPTYHLTTISGDNFHGCRGFVCSPYFGVGWPRCAVADDDGMGAPDHASSPRKTTCTGFRPGPDVASQFVDAWR